MIIKFITPHGEHQCTVEDAACVMMANLPSSPRIDTLQEINTQIVGAAFARAVFLYRKETTGK